MSNKKWSERKYLIGFLCLMSANTLLVILLLHTVLAQTASDPFKDQPPVKVEIVKQEDSPLLITLIGVDNSDEKVQTINITIQNLSSKKIRACVMLHADEFNVGGTSTSIFPVLMSGQVVQHSHSEARANIRASGKIFLSIDYVEFEDGSSWGNDAQKQSEYISGHGAGEKNGIKEIRQLLMGQNKNAVSELLKKEVSEVTPSDTDDKKPEKWQRGFISGYRSVLIRLKFAYEKQGMEGVSFRLEEIEKLTKKEEK